MHCQPNETHAAPHASIKAPLTTHITHVAAAAGPPLPSTCCAAARRHACTGHASSTRTRYRRATATTAAAVFGQAWPLRARTFLVLQPPQSAHHSPAT